VAVRIGIDIGGTFTDFVVADSHGVLSVWKEDSTPADPVRAVLHGLEAIAAQRGQDLAALMAQVELIVHGTTIATNTLIERTGPVAGLLCTAGFRDILHLRDGYKSERFNIRQPHPGELIPRSLRRPVQERISAAGEIITPLREADVAAAAAIFRAAGVNTVAVAFLWSVANPAHEVRAAEVLAQQLPGADVVCSHDVLPEMREWERTSAAAISAYVRPRLRGYLSRLEHELASRGLRRPPLIVQNNGGCSSIRELLSRPVYLVASGPAAAPAAARRSSAHLKAGTVIILEAGGTSTEVSTLRHGEPGVTRSAQVAGQPLGVAAVDVTSIGAGGGSIGWIDPGGALRVGPASAGAVPGPACYGQGGLAPTVTDAHVVLGTLAPDAFLAGRRALDRDRAVAAIRENLAVPLGTAPEVAAAGIINVLEANMVAAIREISVGRGIDPRQCVLAAGGGAGGLHATRVAGQLGIRTVVIPLQAGALCAFGMLVSDVRHEDVAPLFGQAGTLPADSVDALLAKMDQTAVARLAGEGFGEQQISVRHAHELTIPVPTGPLNAETAVADLTEAFHRAHAAAFSYARPDVEVEFLHWRVLSAGTQPEPESPAPHGESAALPTEIPDPVAHREIFHPVRREPVMTAVYQAADIAPGMDVTGPAVLQGATTTILLDEGDVLRARPHAYEIELSP
jgi:N-methylhydantoinase A